jgi:diaminopimelate epimerase
MKIRFQKYQANGNDFVMLVEKDTGIALTEKQITKLCDRHFGIGADGLMVLRNSEAYDFEMHYYNSDGKKASMCGNGGRSIASLAYSLGYAGKRMVFLASDGVHEAIIEKEIVKGSLYDVSLKMVDVEKVAEFPDYCFLNTGVPHYVEFVGGLSELDVVTKGRQIRFDSRFGEEGTNANFVEVLPDRIEIRTYERGVEDETLSCGTGVTASAIATYVKTGKMSLPIQARGGSFKVSFEQKDGRFVNVWLRGPAEKIFDGEIDI